MCVVCGCGTGHSHAKTEAPATDSDVQVDATGDLHYGAARRGFQCPA
jgi:hydrogenase nickel incorporation protein HypB